MELVGRTKITRISSRKGVYYPMVRHPQEYVEVIGKYANVYAVDSSHFLIEVVEEKNPRGNFKTKFQQSNGNKNETNVTGTKKIREPVGKRARRDSNPRPRD